MYFLLRVFKVTFFKFEKFIKDNKRNIDNFFGNHGSLNCLKIIVLRFWKIAFEEIYWSSQRLDCSLYDISGHCPKLYKRDDQSLCLQDKRTLFYIIRLSFVKKIICLEIHHLRYKEHSKWFL